MFGGEATTVGRWVGAVVKEGWSHTLADGGWVLLSFCLVGSHDKVCKGRTEAAVKPVLGLNYPTATRRSCMRKAKGPKYEQYICFCVQLRPCRPQHRERFVIKCHSSPEALNSTKQPPISS